MPEQASVQIPSLPFHNDGSYKRDYPEFPPPVCVRQTAINFTVWVTLRYLSITGLAWCGCAYVNTNILYINGHEDFSIVRLVPPVAGAELKLDKVPQTSTRNSYPSLFYSITFLHHAMHVPINTASTSHVIGYVQSHICLLLKTCRSGPKMAELFVNLKKGCKRFKSPSTSTT